MNKNFGENLLFALGELSLAVWDAFSRESLSKKMLKIGRVDTRYFNRSLKRYEKRGLIKSFKKDDKNYYHLTEKGFLKLNEHKINNNFNLKQKRWDGHWRLVTFDVPEDKKYAREALRRRLKFFKFFPFQKSVFVFPYPCEKEIRALGEYFEINDRIEIIITDHLGRRNEEIKALFNL